MFSPLHLLLSLLLVLPCAGNAQHFYVPQMPDTSVRKENQTHFTSAHAHHMDTLKHKDYKEFSEKRHLRIKNNLEEEEFLFDEQIYKTTQAIFSRIINPGLKKEPLRLFISRSATPNAYCFGEGSVVINLGLLARLHNEDQLAFVLSHEMAHQYQRHSENLYWKSYRTLHSKEFKKKVKQIEREGTHQLSRLENLLKGMKLETTKHSRYKESEADSLGLLFMEKAGYRPAAALSSLLLLDGIDQPKYRQQIQFEDWFDGENLEMVYRRTGDREGLDIEQKTDSALLDSLKTHPECKERMHQLMSSFQILSTAVDTSLTFTEIKRIADYEIIHHAIKENYFGESLYHAMVLLQYQPEDLYLRQAVAISLAGIYLLQEGHQLGKYIQPARSEDPPNYRMIHNLIHNIRLSELKALTLDFMENHTEVHESEYSLYQQYLQARLKKENSDSLADTYKEKYPQGFFIHSIN